MILWKVNSSVFLHQLLWNQKQKINSDASSHFGIISHIPYILFIKCPKIKRGVGRVGVNCNSPKSHADILNVLYCLINNIINQRCQLTYFVPFLLCWKEMETKMWDVCVCMCVCARIHSDYHNVKQLLGAPLAAHISTVCKQDVDPSNSQLF